MFLNSLGKHDSWTVCGPLEQPCCHLPLAAQYQYLRIKYYTSYSSIREPWKKTAQGDVRTENARIKLRMQELGSAVLCL